MEAPKRPPPVNEQNLDYATLGFTENEYEEAIKRVGSRDDANQLLVALLEVSKCHKPAETNQLEVETKEMQCDVQQAETSSSATPAEAATSGYSSNNSFSSTSIASSLESLPTQQARPTNPDVEALRRVYIDGSNVARTHGKNGHFSWLGIKICVDWFQRRGHKVKVLVPMDKCQMVAASHGMEASVLEQLRFSDVLIETPTGCNDDMFIIEAARQKGGIIVSNDLYRDERRRFGSTENLDRFIYLNRLPFIFDDDLFIPANDPRGRSGPKLDEFLRSRWREQQDSGQRSDYHEFRQRTSLPDSAMIKRATRMGVEDPARRFGGAGGSSGSGETLMSFGRSFQRHKVVHRVDSSGNHSPLTPY